MAVSIRSIGTAVPPTIIRQDDVREIFATQPGLGRLGQRIVGAAFGASAIETRHTVVDELDRRPREGEPTFYDAASNEILRPGTGARNQVYVDRSPELFLDAARAALAGAPDLGPEDVTHVISVSCTGFFAPGPDYLLVRGLGLSPSTRRHHLGFMGCYGAFPALAAARDFCLADPEAVVLVVCAELCTLHLRSSDDPDSIVASSVFADGAAAAVVTARPAPSGSVVLDLDVLETVLTPVGETDMAWSIGDLGFDMVLSSYVPQIIELHIDSALAPLFEAGGVGVGDVDLWAVHPGGRSILDRVQQQLGLTDAHLAPSRDVLRDYGNMSSATVLFILAELLGGPAAPSQRVGAMAFGPGLTVETALMTRRAVS
jgi:predicted naringenin-chalcone synthase